MGNVEIGCDALFFGVSECGLQIDEPRVEREVSRSARAGRLSREIFSLQAAMMSNCQWRREKAEGSTRRGTAALRRRPAQHAPPGSGRIPPAGHRWEGGGSTGRTESVDESQKFRCRLRRSSTVRRCRRKPLTEGSCRSVHEPASSVGVAAWAACGASYRCGTCRMRGRPGRADR